MRDMNDNTVIFVVIYHKGYGVKKSIKVEVVIEVDIVHLGLQLIWHLFLYGGGICACV